MRTMRRYSGAVAAAVLLSLGTMVHRPVHEVQIVASKFMFEPAVIEVTAGEPVRLVIRSNVACSEFCGNGVDQMKAALISIAAMSDNN